MLILATLLCLSLLGCTGYALDSTPFQDATANPLKITLQPGVLLNKPGAAKITSPPTQTASDPITDYSNQLSDFDYFVLALSWSPDYCATDGTNDAQQCSLGKRLAFVLHGLWPQYNQGYPSSCSTELLPASVKARFPGLFPSDALFTHEWEKHGTCTGLSPLEYLTLSKQLKASVTIPAQFQSPEKAFRTSVAEIRQVFTAANPGMPASGLAIFCSGSGRFLKELYVCLSRQGQFMACSSEVLKNSQRSCQAADFLVRNIR